MTREQAETIDDTVSQKKNAATKRERKEASSRLIEFHENHVGHTLKLTDQLEERTGIESRLDHPWASATGWDAVRRRSDTGHSTRHCLRWTA